MWWWIIRKSFPNVKSLCWRQLKRVKSFQPHSGFGVSTFFGSHAPLWLKRLWKKRTQKPALCLLGDQFIQIFCTPVWSDECASLPCRSSSTNKSYIISSKSPLRSMRSFCVAMMDIFCQSLIGCSRSLDGAAHGPQPIWKLFSLLLPAGSFRSAALRPSWLFFDAATFQSVPVSGVDFFFLPRVVGGSQKCVNVFALVAWGRAGRYPGGHERKNVYTFWLPLYHC